MTVTTALTRSVATLALALVAVIGTGAPASGDHNEFGHHSDSAAAQDRAAAADEGRARAAEAAAERARNAASMPPPASCMFCAEPAPRAASTPDNAPATGGGPRRPDAPAAPTFDELVTPGTPAAPAPTVGPVAPPTTVTPPRAPADGAAPTTTVTPPLLDRNAESAVPGSDDTAVPDDAPTTTREVDGSSRTKNFLTGETVDGAFDPAPYQAWYIQRQDKIEVFGKDVATVPDGGDLMWGQTSDLFFTGYKNIVHATVTFVGLLVFGLMFVLWLLEPALALAESFRTNLIEPANLPRIALALAASFAAYNFFRRRYGTAVMEYGTSAVVIGLSALLIPGDAVRYVVSLVSGSAAVTLVAASGGNPTSVPAASTGPLDTSAIMAAYQGFTGRIEELMIAQVAQIITFGAVLPDACQAAYKTGLDKNLTSTDPDNFTALQAIAACRPYVEQAAQPDAPRAFFAGLLLLYSVLFAVAYAFIAWPALKGQIQLMFAVGAHKFLIIGAALPGTLRHTAVRLILKTTLGVFALVVFALYLALMLLSMVAIFAGTQTLPMFIRLVAVLLVPVALIFVQLKHRKKEKQAVNKATNMLAGQRQGMAQGRTGYSSRAERMLYGGRRSLGDLASDAAFGAAGAATGGAITAARFAAKTARQGTTAAVAGTSRVPGLLLGAKTVPVTKGKGATATAPANGSTAAPTTPATPAPATPTATPTGAGTGPGRANGPRVAGSRKRPAATAAATTAAATPTASKPTPATTPAKPAPVKATAPVKRREATTAERLRGGLAVRGAVVGARATGASAKVTASAATASYRAAAKAAADAVRADALATRRTQDAATAAKDARRPAGAVGVRTGRL